MDNFTKNFIKNQSNHKKLDAKVKTDNYPSLLKPKTSPSNLRTLQQSK
jgi:hypothetical protein